MSDVGSVEIYRQSVNMVFQEQLQELRGAATQQASVRTVERVAFISERLHLGSGSVQLLSDGASFKTWSRQKESAESRVGPQGHVVNHRSC